MPSLPAPDASTRVLSPITVTSAAYKEAGADYHAGAHSYDGYQWYGVLHGQVRMRFDEGDQVLDPETSVLIPPHCTRCPRAGRRPPGYFYVHFQNHGLRLHGIERRVMATPAELRADVHALAEELRQHPGIHTHALIDALTVRVLIGLQRHAIHSKLTAEPVLSPLNATYHEDIVRRVEAFMQRHLHRRLSRQELADVVHLSAPHLARVFRAVLDKTPAQRLTELRMARAKSLLLKSTLSITGIAVEVGYNSFSHFAKTFKQATSVSPSDYRRAAGHQWIQKPQA